MKEAGSSNCTASAEDATNDSEIAGSSKSFSVFANTINGKSCNSEGKSQSVNPSTRRPLWDVPVATNDDVNAAVAAAKEAFLTWSQTPWAERAQYLSRAKEALMEVRDDMANLIMQEAGKPVSTS